VNGIGKRSRRVLMSAADDKATLRRIPLEVLNEGRLEVIDEVLAEDFHSHSAGTRFPPDRDGLNSFISALGRHSPTSPTASFMRSLRVTSSCSTCV
jgi:hypothetical protein